MNKIESILFDFYNCIGVPIQFLRFSDKTISKVGFTPSVEFIMNDLPIYKDIEEFKYYNDKITYDNIHFSTLRLDGNEFYKGYFLIGPFSSKIENNDTLPYKPHYCIEMIINLLRKIINEKLHGELNFNKYILDSIKYIHKNYSNDIKIDDVCCYLNLNKSYFCTLFKKETGYTFSNFLNKFRVEKSKKLLCNRNLTIMDIAFSVGYNNHNYYTMVFKKHCKYTPLQYRNEIISSLNYS